MINDLFRLSTKQPAKRELHSRSTSTNHVCSIRRAGNGARDIIGWKKSHFGPLKIEFLFQLGVDFVRCVCEKNAFFFSRASTPAKKASSELVSVLLLHTSMSFARLALTADGGEKLG